MELKEIRFSINKEVWDFLKKKADYYSVPLSSYLKANLEDWANGRRTTK